MTVGPVSSASHILLWLCLDGLRGTRQCGADELARISDALRAVETMAGLQRSIMQVGAQRGLHSRLSRCSYASHEN